jgi:thioredoxin reductase (NADPH)
LEELRRAGNITVRLQTEVTGVHGAGRLEALTVRDGTTGKTGTLRVAALFILIGAEPHTDWLGAALPRDERGFLLTGPDLAHDGKLPGAWPLDRPPLLLEAGLPGVFAAGDVRHGSVKRVASAVGEGAIAIQLVHEYLREPEARPVPFSAPRDS